MPLSNGKKSLVWVVCSATDQFIANKIQMSSQHSDGEETYQLVNLQELFYFWFRCIGTRALSRTRLCISQQQTTQIISHIILLALQLKHSTVINFNEIVLSLVDGFLKKIVIVEQQSWSSYNPVREREEDETELGSRQKEIFWEEQIQNPTAMTKERKHPNELYKVSPKALPQ